MLMKQSLLWPELNLDLGKESQLLNINMWLLHYCFNSQEMTFHLLYITQDKNEVMRWTHLEVSALGLQPVVDKALRISSKTQHEFSLRFQLVNGFNGFVDLKEML